MLSGQSRMYLLCTRIRCCLSGGWETNGAKGERERERERKREREREREKEGEMWPEYGLINYGVQTALERERLVR